MRRFFVGGAILALVSEAFTRKREGGGSVFSGTLTAAQAQFGEAPIPADQISP